MRGRSSTESTVETGDKSVSRFSKVDRLGLRYLERLSREAKAGSPAQSQHIVIIAAT